MTPEDFRDYLIRQPFAPFRVHLNNGRWHDVRHPEMALVLMDAVVLGIHEAGEDFPRHSRTLALVNITELEPLATAS